MSELSALNSAIFAERIYRISKILTPEAFEASIEEFLGKNWVSYTDSPIMGKTGGPGLFKSKSGFGLLLLGRGSKYSGHAVIVFRGTQYLGDWLTNLNDGVSASAFGQPVHDGFNTAFKSMKGHLMSCMKQVLNAHQKEKIHTVHIVGHSLGGGLALICAEWLKANYKSYSIKTYTFGSPRVGTQGFSYACTSILGAKNIYRVYHSTDIVPYIPTWPFFHTPLHGKDYYIKSPGLMPYKTWHDMTRYENSVTAGNGSSIDWKTLYASRPPEPTEPQLLAWLKEKPVFGITIKLMEWVSRILQSITKELFRLGNAALDIAFTSTFSLLDQLSYILKKGIDLSNHISEKILLLVRKIMVALGLGGAVDATDLTAAYIRNIFTRLLNRAYDNAQQAIDSVLLKEV